MTATTPAREHVSVLRLVELDRERSTPWHEYYHATSDRTIGLRYAVRHDVEQGSWSCECPAYQFSDLDPAKRTCKHARRCQRLRRVQWWHAYYLGWGPADLIAALSRYRAREAAGEAREDDHAAIDALVLLLGPSVEREAA